MRNKSDQGRESWLYMARSKMIVGLAVFVVSAGLIANVIGLQIRHPERSHAVLGVAILGIFACGGLVTCCRGGTTLDRGRRVLTRWKGPFVPLVRREIPFDAIRAVRFGPGLWPGYPQAARERAFSFHAAVETDAGPTVVWWGQSEVDARRIAERISGAIGDRAA